MDFKQLEAFVYVVKLNSFSKAADCLYLSQPTISAQISSLEKELESQLLIRSTKEIYPTKVGKELYNQALNILALRDQAVQCVKSASSNSKGEINLIASSVPAQYLLPPIIAAFHEQYPNILIHVHQTDSLRVGELLKDCYYDFGISGMQLTSNKYIQKPFYKDTVVFAYPASYDIDESFTRDHLLSFIKSHPFVFRESGSGTLNELDRYLKIHQLSLTDLRPAAYFSNTQGVLHAVACGLGISFVSKVAASVHKQVGSIKTIEIDHKDFSRSFYILQKKDMVLSPVQTAFVSFLLAYERIGK